MWKKEKECTNNRIKETEDANKQNETRKLYKEIKKLNNENLPTVPICKDLNGKIQPDKTQALKRWKQYFLALLNNENYWNVRINI
jgi:ribosomal 50S subunit-associated protein YjgA (DUF615 family)